jgi:ADP-heptose:LPS heptosyltransferase
LGEGNIIPSRLDKELFYEQANRLLTWLGYRAVSRVPELVYISHEEVFARYDITKKQYIVFHLCGSDAGKSLPKERWNHIFHVLRQKFPTTPFVFSGGPRDVAFIESCLGGLDRSLLYNLAGKVSLQELLTLYKEALVTVSVHTGNAILVNMLHVPTVMVNMKGVYMFKYHYNKHSIDLASTEGCECDPYERKCHDVIHGGIPYMSCIFTIKDEAIIDAVEKQIVAYK